MTFLAAAFCPHPPLLVPEIGMNEPVAARAPALAAVRWLLQRPVARVVVLGSGNQPSTFGPGSVGGFAGFGVDRQVQLPGPLAAATPGARLPLSLAVGAWLLEQAGWRGATLGVTSGPSGELPDLEDDGQVPAALLVMGDGSARRSEKAPGWLDERSAAYDTAVCAAMASGDPGSLAPDLALGAQLLAAGAPAWTGAAELLKGTQWKGTISYDDAPYGVGYLVATWSVLTP